MIHIDAITIAITKHDDTLKQMSEKMIKEEKMLLTLTHSTTMA